MDAITIALFLWLNNVQIDQRFMKADYYFKPSGGVTLVISEHTLLPKEEPKER